MKIKEDQLWHIWSHEHKAYWGPHSQGYTSDISNAATYSTKNAFSCIDKLTGWPLAPNCEPKNSLIPVLTFGWWLDDEN